MNTEYIKIVGIVDTVLATNPIDDNLRVSAQKGYNDIIAHMGRIGWSLAGSGFFSIVFTSGGKVAKVCLKLTDCAVVYAAWCRSNAGRPGVPRVAAIHRGTRCCVVGMEEYYPAQHLLEIDSRFFDATLANRVHNVGAVLSGGRTALAGMSPYDAADPLLGTALAMHEFFDGIASNDMHYANVMVDRDGNLVITDPFSYLGFSDPEGPYYYDGEPDDGITGIPRN